MATVELFEKWTTEGPWEYTAPVSVDANGVLTVDADTNGVTSFYPCFAQDHYVFADSKHMEGNARSMTTLYEFSATFTASGVFTLGFLTHPAFASSYFSKYQFRYDGTGVRFFAKGSTSFDNGTLIPGASIKVRVAFSDSSHLISVCTADNVLIATDTTNTYHSLDTGMHAYYETTNDAMALVTGPSTSSLSFVSATVILTVKSGAVKFNPTRIVTTVAEGDTYAVTNGTSASLKLKPTTPALTITPYQNGLNQVSMVAPDANTFIVTSRNRGALVSVASDVIEDTLRIDSGAGGSKVFTTSRPSVFRTVATNGTVSGMTTQYVGPTTDVAIPEISISRWKVSSSASGCVRMFCADADATIRYTVDGTEPTSSSLVYSTPLFVKSSALVRAKSFKGALSSVTVNATYIKSGLAIPNPYDPSMWVYNGNASFTASSLTVTDPTGIGVAFREDVYEQSSYDTLDYGNYASGATGFQYVLSFNVSGPFRMKAPGTDAHLAWIGNAIGLVANTGATPATSMASAVSAKVTITGNKYVSGSYTYKNVVTIIGYDSGGTQVMTTTFNYETQPIGTYSNVVSFTSEGISPFTLTNVSMSILSSAGASLDTGLPLIDTEASRNVAGAVAPTATTADTGNLLSWDIEKSWPVTYRNRLSWRIEDMQNVAMSFTADNLLATDKKINAYYSGTAADVGNAWFTSKIKLGSYVVPVVSTFSFGWSSLGVNTPAIQIKKAPGISTDMDVNGAVGGGSIINLVSSTYDLGTTQGKILRGVKHDLVWRCGRKVEAGKMYVRTVLLDEGGDADYNPVLNNIVHDTGWVDAGAVPTTLPRPKFSMRGPLLSVSGMSEENDLSYQTFSVLGDLSVTQVESCLLYGAVDNLPAPTLAVGAQASNGTYPVTVTCAGATSIVVCAGSKPLRAGTAASNRWSVTSGSVVSVPDMSLIRAIGIGSTSTMFSPVSSVYTGSDTSDYISVTTRPGLALLRVLPRTKTYSPTVTSIETIWSLWLNGVRFCEIDLATPGDIEINLEAGSYSALLRRELRAGRNAGVVGSTATPVTFVVPDLLDISVVAPTTVVAGQSASFVATATGAVSWTWSFSDGSNYTTGAASVVFAKPGKYRWSVTATTPSGDIAQQIGSIVATFAPGLVLPTTRVVGNQERVS